MKRDLFGATQYGSEPDAPVFFATDEQLDASTALEAIEMAQCSLRGAERNARSALASASIESSEARDECIEECLALLRDAGYAHLLKKVYQSGGDRDHQPAIVERAQ